MAMGVNYIPREGTGLPRMADVVIGVRKPGLLGAVRNVKHRLLWVPGAPEYLTSPANAPLWESFQPAFLFVNSAQQRAYGSKIRNTLLRPGTRPAFQKEEAPAEPATAPYASLPHQQYFDSNDVKPPEEGAAETQIGRAHV